jgi:hypothetical protein
MHLKKCVVFVHTAGFQDFFHHIFHKKNILHLPHVLKQKLDIVTGL